MKKYVKILAMVCIAFLLMSFTEGKSPSLSLGWLDGVLDETAKIGRKFFIIRSATIVHEFYLSVFDNMPTIAAANPPIWSIKHFMGFFINLLQPFYILAIMLTGFYIIFVSQSPRNRAKAKFWFGKLIIGLIFISVSPYVVSLMFEVSGALTRQIMSLADTNLATNSLRAGINSIWDMFWWLTAIHRYGGIEIYLLNVSLMMMLYMILVMRYVMVGILATLMPVTILFYSWDLTRHVGKMMLEQTVIWIFMQIGWAIGLVTVAIAVITLPVLAPEIPVQFIYLASFLFIVAVPFMILGVMNWLGLGIFAFEVVQAAPVSSGAVAFGETAGEPSHHPLVEEEVVIKPPEDY